MSGLVNVSRVVTNSRFARSSGVVVRSYPGSYNKWGEWVDGTPSDRNATGSWQRVTENELVQVGLGEINQEVRKLLTKEILFISEKDDKRSDRIIDDTRRYKVLKITDNDDYGYNRVYCSFEGYE
jgi:hypothetical protein